VIDRCQQFGTDLFGAGEDKTKKEEKTKSRRTEGGEKKTTPSTLTMTSCFIWGK